MEATNWKARIFQICMDNLEWHIPDEWLISSKGSPTSIIASLKGKKGKKKKKAAVSVG